MSDAVIVRDSRGRFLPGTKPPKPITTENTLAFHRARQEQKRAVVAQAANDAVENGELTTKHGDLAFVAAITQTAMLKATTPDDPKAIDAARFLLQEAGLAEAKQAEQPVLRADNVTLNVLVADVARELVQELAAQAACPPAPTQADSRQTDDREE